jgi:hypothetical protein
VWIRTVQIRGWGSGRQYCDRISMMPRGSGHADPGAQHLYQLLKIFYDAQIREYGSGRQNRYIKIFYDDARIRGVRIRASKPLCGKL